MGVINIPSHPRTVDRMCGIVARKDFIPSLIVKVVDILIEFNYWWGSIDGCGIINFNLGLMVAIGKMIVAQIEELAAKVMNQERGLVRTSSVVGGAKDMATHKNSNRTLLKLLGESLAAEI